MRRFGLILIIILASLALLSVALWSELRPITRDDGVIVAPIFVQMGSHTGDLVVTGQYVDIDASALILGNVSLIGQDVDVAGQINGDLTILADTITLLPDATIMGSVHLLGGEAQISGSIAGDLVLNMQRANIDPLALNLAGVVQVCNQALLDSLALPSARIEPCSAPDVFAPLIALREGVPLLSQTSQEIDLLITVIGGVLFVGVTALLVTITPLRVSRVEEAIRQRPLGSLGVGVAVYMLVSGTVIGAILSLAAFPPLALLTIPVSLIALASAGGLALIGLPTIALMIGDALLVRVGAPQPPLIAAIVGATVLYPLFALGDVLLIGGGAAVALGAGGALVTRWGGQPVQRAYFIQG